MSFEKLAWGALAARDSEILVNNYFKLTNPGNNNWVQRPVLICGSNGLE